MAGKTYGQVGYEAYGDEAQWKAYNDAPMPRWGAPLRDDIKRKWEVAAKAIADKAVEDYKAGAAMVLSQKAVDDFLKTACVQCRNPDHDGICSCGRMVHGPVAPIP